MRFLLFCLLGLLLCSCGQPLVVKGPNLHMVPVDAWPELKDVPPAETLLAAIDRQLNWLEKRPDYLWEMGEVRQDAAALRATLETFRQIYAAHSEDPEGLRARLQAAFSLYRFHSDGSPDILITGYHAPVYEGSRTAEGSYRYPLYAPPKDLVYVTPGAFAPSMLRSGENSRRTQVPARLAGNKVVPYHDREAIDGAQALAGRDLELVYLADYFKVFSFHVQGGGFVRLPSGAFMKFNYAGSNGHPYVSIGRLMIESGKIPREDISMQALAAWFAAHPEDLFPVCFRNPSYVFYEGDLREYTKIEPDLFPNGVLGFPVTTRRSIATDKRSFPGGGLAFIEGEQRGKDRFSAFVLDQDTGGAIRGGHIDWFLGAGAEAEHDAGLLNDPKGRVYFLVLK